MKVPRDAQRRRAYDAESAGLRRWLTEFHEVEWSGHERDRLLALGSIEEVEAFVREVEAGAWWREHSGGCRILAVKLTRRGSRGAWADVTNRELGFASHMLHRDTVIHEMAHLADHWQAPPLEPAHGARWRGILLEGLAAHVCPELAALTAVAMADAGLDGVRLPGHYRALG